MNDLSEFLSGRWLGLICLVCGCALGIRAGFVWMRRGTIAITPALAAGSFLSLAIGGLGVPGEWAFWLALAALAALFIMVIVLVITGAWSSRLGYAFGGLLLAGIGGFALSPVGNWLVDNGKMLRGLELGQPAWL